LFDRRRKKTGRERREGEKRRKKRVGTAGISYLWTNHSLAIMWDAFQSKIKKKVKRGGARPF